MFRCKIIPVVFAGMFFLQIQKVPHHQDHRTYEIDRNHCLLFGLQIQHQNLVSHQIVKHQSNQRHYHRLIIIKKLLKIYRLSLFLVIFCYSRNKEKKTFLLGSSGSTKLCSRLMERYNQITYLSIRNYL
jgi:hypothetical protein